MKVTFELVNSWETTLRLQHENEWLPYRRRYVQITLTPEQVEAIKPKKVGVSGIQDVFEDYGTISFQEVRDADDA